MKPLDAIGVPGKMGKADSTVVPTTFRGNQPTEYHGERITPATHVEVRGEQAKTLLLTHSELLVVLASLQLSQYELLPWEAMIADALIVRLTAITSKDRGAIGGGGKI